MVKKVSKAKANSKSRHYIDESYDEINLDYQEIVFSLKYLDLHDSDFCVDKCKSKYFIALLKRLAEISKLFVNDFKGKYKKALRNHDIEWEDVTRDCFGIPDEEQLVDKPWQFSVSANENGRVVGFFIRNIFYVRWLDCNHNLYD